MNNSFVFYPPRRFGNIAHAVFIVILLVLSGWGLYRAAYAEVGSNFLLYLFPVLFSIPVIPFLIYRWSALQNAVYTLERDSIRLQWGLRTEVIPTNNILWVRPAADLLEKLRLPWLRWPGSVVGVRRFTKEISVEFLAAQTRNLVLIGTYDKVFAISPSDPAELLESYQRLTELGSLTPPQSESVHPGFLLARVWDSRPARFVILLGAGLGLGLLAWTSLVIPNYPEISLGFGANGLPREPIDGVRLMLLPVLNTIFFVVSFFGGMFIYRNPTRRYLAYLLWGNSAFVGTLFLMAVYFILNIP